MEREPRGEGMAIVWPGGRADILYERFKQRIIDREWLPGAPLNIDRLARDYEVSITPVREALARLSAERLVTAAPHRGYTVALPPSHRRLADLFTVRLLLEPAAARGAATRLSRQDLEALRAIQAMLRAEGAGTDYAGMQAYTARNRAFHDLIFRMNANEVLTEIYGQLNYHTVIGHVYHSAGVTDLPEVVAEHDAIIAALAAGDPTAAEAAMHAHIAQGSRRLLAAYHEAEPEAPPATTRGGERSRGRVAGRGVDRGG